MVTPTLVTGATQWSECSTLDVTQWQIISIFLESIDQWSLFLYFDQVSPIQTDYKVSLNEDFLTNF